MTKNTSPLTVITAVATLLLLFPAVGNANRNDVRWQDAAKEMGSLPFPRAFVDSVKRAHIGGPAPRGLRKLSQLPPFVNGETLVYEVSLSGMIRGGYFILSAEPARDRGLIRLSSRAMTSNFISAIYKTRDYAVSWVDAQGLYPHFYEQHIREGNDGKKYSIDKYIVYDNVNGKIFYRRRGNAVEYETPPFTHDFVSFIYYARSMPLRPGATFTADMFSEADRKTYPFRFKVGDKRESVRVGAGTYNCLHIEPTLIGEGRVINKRDKMEIWISDDENRYPVVVKTNIGAGSMTARLIHISK